MKQLTFWISPWVCAMALLALVATVAAADDPAITYTPPADAGPSVRIDGIGTRSTGPAAPSLYMLAPVHVGLTTKEQPTLYWYLSQPVQTRVELAIVQEKKIIPIFDVKVGENEQAGVQRFRFADHHIKLAPGIEYRCTVALVLDRQSRSKDVVASCVIKRIEALSSLTARLATARPSEAAFIYASEGIWFDAMDALAGLIAADPDSAKYRRQRAALLEQVQLADAAAYDVMLASGK